MSSQGDSWLFPSSPRNLPGERWLNVLFRTLHLVGVSGLGAGFLYPAVDSQWRYYLLLTLLSGAGLMLITLYNSAIWLLQLRGQVILLKLLLLAAIYWFPDHRSLLFITVVVLSGWISHATSGVRYYSIYHGKKITCH